jgi:hypothetical protein
MFHSSLLRTTEANWSTHQILAVFQALAATGRVDALGGSHARLYL